MLLYKLVSISDENWKIHARGHTARLVYAHRVRIRLVEEKQADQLRIERRDERWKDRIVRAGR